MIGRLAAACLLAGCAELPDVVLGTCGDGIVGAGEDCDGSADAGCGSPGDARRSCRLLCSADVRCPAGWACAPGGVCAHATAALDPLGSVPVSGDDVFVADVHGDGSPDVVLLRGAAATVIPLDGGGRPAPPVERPAGFPGQGSGAVADLDGDGAAELVLPSPSGLLLLQGSPDAPRSPRAFAPYELPELDRAWFVPVRPPGSSSDHLLRLGEHDGELTAVVVPVPYTGGELVPFPLSPLASLDLLPERLPLADLDGDGGDEIVLASAGARELLVLRLEPSFFSAGVFEVRRAATIPLVEGRLPDRPALHLADATGDGQPDVLVSGGTSVLVARGDGRGGFEAAVAGEGPWDADVGELLSLADLDMDGRADAVGSRALHTARGVHVVLPSTRDGSSWDEAVVGDLDGDARPDLALGSRRGDLALLLQRCRSRCAEPLFVVEPRVAPGGVRRLRTADLDGHHGGDLAFVVERPGGEEAVGVLFGTTGGAPREPSIVASFASVHRLEPGLLSDLQGSTDAAAELVVTASEAGAIRLAVFQGTPGQVLDSPLALQSGNVPDRPLSVRAGSFGGTGTSLAAVAVGPRGPRLWHLGSDLAPLPGSLRPGAGSLDPVCFQWHAGDVDGDGREGLVGVARSGCGPPQIALVEVGAGGPDVKVTMRELRSAPSASCLARRKGGGHDLVLSGGGRTELLPGADPDRAVDLGIPVVTSCVRMQRDAGEELDLVVATGTAVLVLREDTDPVALPGVSGTTLAAADLDGDGLDDLVVTDGARTALLRTRPHLEDAP